MYKNEFRDVYILYDNLYNENLIKDKEPNLLKKSN